MRNAGTDTRTEDSKLITHENETASISSAFSSLAQKVCVTAAGCKWGFGGGSQQWGSPAALLIFTTPLILPSSS